MTSRYHSAWSTAVCAVALVASLTAGPAYAATDSGASENTNYCAYLKMAAPTSTAPGALPASAPAPATAPASAPAADAPRAIPSVRDLLKETSDAKQIVGTVLDAAAPRKAEEFDAMYDHIFAEIARTYIEPADLIANGLPAYKEKYRGKMKNWSDFNAALKDLFKAVGNRWTYVQDPADALAAAIGQRENKVDFGAHLHQREDGRYVIEFLSPGSTAQLGGLREDDEIISVNGHTLKGMVPVDAEKLLRSAEGDSLHVVSVQDGRPVEADYTLHAPADDADTPKIDLLQNNLAYIKLPSFMDQEAFVELLGGLVKLQATTPGGLQGIILDLRYNGGGYVTLAKILISTLSDSGVVLHEKKRNGREVEETTTSLIPTPAIMQLDTSAKELAADMKLKTLPLVILINGSSASASEIVTGSLKESRPNTVVMGRRSFGKFVEMTIQPTPNCGKMAIMSAMYTTPKGNWWQGLGITPDIIVDQPRASHDDVQLSSAVDWLKKRSAGSGAEIAVKSKPDEKLLGRPLEKPLEMPASTTAEWLSAHRGDLVLGLAAALFVLVGVGLFFLTKPRSESGARK